MIAIGGRGRVGDTDALVAVFACCFSWKMYDGPSAVIRRYHCSDVLKPISFEDALWSSTRSTDVDFAWKGSCQSNRPWKFNLSRSASRDINIPRGDTRLLFSTNVIEIVLPVRSDAQMSTNGSVVCSFGDVSLRQIQFTSLHLNYWLHIRQYSRRAS